jgi:nicotinate phosphoribosyltransferase
MRTSALFTDFYELTMAQGYWKNGLDKQAVFDVFFRRQPFNGGFSVFAGLDPLLDILANFRFSENDLDWLAAQGRFEPAFLDYLKDFRFRGTVHAIPEGEIVFPQVPLLRIHGGLIEAQLIEGLVLNMINFQSLIATKSARVAIAAKNHQLMEFGLRRAQGFDGAMSASRAAFIGGVHGTSNTLAGKTYGIPVMGTMGHSWIMAFRSELEAFEAYSNLYPDATVFLIDTFDTLESGIKNAITVGRRLVAAGHRFGVRLDSGDIDYLSRVVRSELDAAGLQGAFIAVSNELDENIIEHLVAEGAPIDVWGVGTHMVTGGSESAFTGVYKLAAIERDGVMVPTMKLSDNPDKTTNPGIKNAYRFHDANGMAVADVLALEHEDLSAVTKRTFHHPSLDPRRFAFLPCTAPRRLLEPVMRDGHRLRPPRALEAIRADRAAALATFDHTYCRFLNPHIYKVSITEELRKLKMDLMERL